MPPSRGRPPINPDDRLSVPVSVRIPSADYDRLFAMARRARTSIPTVLRQALRDKLRRERDHRGDE